MAKKGKMQLTIDNAREAREISLSPRKTDAAIGIKYAIMEGIRSIGKASSAAIAVALTITVLITLLFMRMLIAKDRHEIAVMKAFGFTNSDIKAQIVARSAFVLIIGILLGTFLANTLGEALTGRVIASFGASSFDFVVNPLAAYLISPLLMMFSVLIATIFGTLDVAQIKIFENIKE